MRLVFLRRHSNVLLGIFGRQLWYLVILICHFDNFSIWKWYLRYLLSDIVFWGLFSFKIIKNPGRFTSLSSFKKLAFARLFSLNFSCKSSLCHPVPLKFESYNLQHCKNNCRKLVFWVFSEQLLDHTIFMRLHFYSFKKYNKALPQKSETKIFDQKLFRKELVWSQEKKNLGLLRV